MKEKYYILSAANGQDALTGFKTRNAYYNDIELFENDITEE